MSSIDHASFVFAGSLQRANRLHFDPSNKEHRAAYVKFTRTGRWDISFYADPKLDSIPRTIEAKLAAHALRAEIAEYEAKTGEHTTV
jgi:hypothetical protein